jgi:exopolysaccharide production protein ExoQ
MMLQSSANYPMQRCYASQTSEATPSAPIAEHTLGIDEGRVRPVSPLLRICFMVGLLFLFPAFTFELAFDQINFKFTSSPILQTISAGTELIALITIFGSRKISRMVQSCWPFLIMIALAFMSTIWSIDRAATIKASNVFATVALFSFALVGRLGAIDCVRFVIRMMVLGCVLSIIWVIVFPNEAIHQAVDQAQAIHAGLWRGIFTHKQGLGVFAGLTTGLMLFYGGIAFSSPPVRVAAIMSGIACMIGTESTTGFLTAVITPALLYGTYAVTKLPRGARSGKFNTLLLSGLALVAAFHLGVLDFVPRLLGKSSDLTGRTDIWPLAMEFFKNSGAVLLGGGFGSGFAGYIIDAPIDSGYIDKIIEFGYLGSTVVFAMHLWILLAGRRLVIEASPERAAIDVFPFCVVTIVMVINITEGLFMEKHITTVLTAIAAALTVQSRTSSAGDGLQVLGRR